jgi:hypothetical protein
MYMDDPAVTLTCNGKHDVCYQFTLTTPTFTIGVKNNHLSSVGYNVNIECCVIMSDGPCGIWTQLGQDIDGGNIYDRSGQTVSMNSAGDRVAIGAPASTVSGKGVSTGRVKVYQWNGTTWVQLGQDIDGEAGGDGSGSAISMNSAGDRVAIGSPLSQGAVPDFFHSGQVRIYQWNGATWTQLGQDIEGGIDVVGTGNDVSMNSAGDRVFILASECNYPRRAFNSVVRVYQWNGTTWTRLGQDVRERNIYPNGEDYSSISANSAGDIFAIGNAHYVMGSVWGSGYVGVYQWNGTTWAQLGQNRFGKQIHADRFGAVVSINSAGNIVAVGAPGDSSSGGVNGEGYVGVYQWNGTTWTQLGQYIAVYSLLYTTGISLSINSAGDRVTIGEPRNDNVNGVDAGRVRVYQLLCGMWVLLGQNILGEAVYDGSGWSVSINSAGNRVAIGAPYNDPSNNPDPNFLVDPGQVRVYELKCNLT